MRRWVWVLGLWACDSGGDGGSTQVGSDGGVGDAGMPFVCDETLRRAIAQDPPAVYECGGEPEFVTIGGTVQVFKYEASHPLATATAAFPCADVGETDFKAPQLPTEACSAAGVRPWHSVPWDDAEAACEAIGWRLCSSAELLRACGGEDNLTFAYGGQFEAGKCNVREAFRADGAETASEAPAGAFEACESPTGAFDVNGNLWEWISDRNEADGRARTYQGAGYRTTAQRHQDSEQACATQVPVPSLSAPTYANAYVGFRCCRSAP